VLVAIDVQVVADGIGHAAVSLWSEDGELLALANQSLALREPTSRSSCAPDPFR
jgi:acyl-CoA thioesterase